MSSYSKYKGPLPVEVEKEILSNLEKQLEREVPLEKKFSYDIDETAYVDPSAVLLGNVKIGKWSIVMAGTVIVGDAKIGDYTTIYCNCAIRGGVEIGNYAHIYDNCCLEVGRTGDRLTIHDKAWVNHGATLHGSEVGEYAAIGLNASLDYASKVEDGAIVTNGSAVPLGMVVPKNCVASGVPAKIVQRDITEEDRRKILGLSLELWIPIMTYNTKRYIMSKKRLQSRK